MKAELTIAQTCLYEMGDLHLVIDGHQFRADEKYTILEMGWALYMAEENVSEEWMREHGETRPAEKGCDELTSNQGCLITSHPVLVALALRAWWHRNGREISTSPQVLAPTFEEAVAEVRQRKILNDFNAHLIGNVSGLRRWQPPIS